MIMDLHVKTNKIKPKVLVVSFFFAPSDKVGAKRFTFLSKILNAECSELHILTLNEKKIKGKDYSLKANGVKHFTGMYPFYYPGQKVNFPRKVFNRIFSDYFCVVDQFSGWILPAIFKGLKVIRSRKIDIIISTGPPFSSMVIAYFLSLFTSAKLILDYRDPWSNHSRKFCKFCGKMVNRLIEKYSIDRADALIFCSNKMKENFIRFFGVNLKSKCRVIHNGYFNTVEARKIRKEDSKINIAYAGEFYGDRKISVIANPLFQLLNEKIIKPDNFCFHIFGNLNAKDKMIIKHYGLSEIIKEHTKLPFAQVIQFLGTADILLLIIDISMNYSIAYKFFDYLSVKRPIFAIIPENSAMADMMDEIDCGRCALITSKESILSNLRKMLTEKKEYSFSGAEKYTWENAGRKYLEVINEISYELVKSGL
jgi:glycosyltransferase involved in cell wall biosynthesis